MKRNKSLDSLDSSKIRKLVPTIFWDNYELITSNYQDFRML